MYILYYKQLHIVKEPLRKNCCCQTRRGVQMAMCREEKPDLQVGDVIEINGKQWTVKSTGFLMSFENLDKDDNEVAFSHIGGMETFKNGYDYKIINEVKDNK